MPMTHRGSVGFVYVAWVDYQGQAAIKVGFTTDVAKRMRRLKGDLIHSHPGSFLQEQRLHAFCRRFRCQPSWPETYRPEVWPVLTSAWSRVFAAELPEAVA